MRESTDGNITIGWSYDADGRGKHRCSRYTELPAPSVPESRSESSAEGEPSRTSWPI